MSDCITDSWHAYINGLSAHQSVGECRQRTFKWATTTSLQILNNSLFMIIFPIWPLQLKRSH